MGENLDSILNLPRQYDALSEGLAKRFAGRFRAVWFRPSAALHQLNYPPVEVQKPLMIRAASLSSMT